MSSPAHLGEELARAGRAVLVCGGDSMAPTIRRGEPFEVRPLPRTTLGLPRITAGDLVVFATADGRDLVVHRVLAHLPGLPVFVHAGDAGSPRLAPTTRLRGYVPPIHPPVTKGEFSGNVKTGFRTQLRVLVRETGFYVLAKTRNKISRLRGENVTPDW